MKHGPSLTFRLTVYPLVLLLFIIISALVVFFAAGYNIKYKDGRFVTEKTGVIIVSTRPGEALVALDGEVQPQKTPSLQIFNLKIKRVVSGNHHLVVSREGYETWEGDVWVEPGLVSWRNYLVLVPLERKADPYNLAGNVEASIVSKDRSRLVLFTVDRVQNVYNLWQVNTENKTSQKIAEGLLVAGDKIELLEIASDKSKLLYKKIGANQKSSYVVQELKDRGLSYDLTSLFNNQAERYYFSPFNNNEMFFVQAGALYRINLEDKTQSTVLIRDIVGVYSMEDRLLAIRKVENNYGLWSISNNMEASNIIKALPASVSYRVSYLDTPRAYLIQGSEDKDLLLYSTETKNPTLETIGRNVTLFMPSAQGTAVAIYSEGQLKTLNLLERKYYQTVAVDKLHSLDWLRDDKNIIYGSEKELRLVNYNGDYNKLLFPLASGTTAISSYANHNLFFTDTKEADKDLYSFSL